MSRFPPLELPHALHPVIARGDRREAIYVDDTNRRLLLEIPGRGVRRHEARRMR